MTTYAVSTWVKNLSCMDKYGSKRAAIIACSNIDEGWFGRDFGLDCDFN